MKHIIRAAMVGSLVFLGSPTLHAVFTIDSFDTAQTNIISSGAGVSTNFTSKSASEAIGGERDIFIERKPGGSTAALSLKIPGNFGGGTNVASLNTAAGANRSQAMIVWDGVDGAAATNYTGLYTGPTGFNLTQHGFAFEVGYQSDHLAALEFRVYTDSTNFSGFTLSVPAGTSFANSVINFTDFTLLGGTGANFSTVGAITMLMDANITDSTDMDVDYLMVVPEPSSAALGLLGACGLALGRRRRRS